MKSLLILAFQLILSLSLWAQQQKILFDASKAESAANADWVIDADLHNLGFTPGPVVGDGNEANPQRFPNPDQANVTATTSENYWNGGISAWGIDLVKKGFYVETLPYNGSISYGNPSNIQDLSNYKVFIVCEPNILFSAEEKTAIINFVQNGGGLMMVSDHINSDRNNDGWDSPQIWNDFMSNNSIDFDPFGMTFDYADFSQTTSNMPNLPDDPLLHGIMGDVTQAQWSAGTSLSLTPNNNTSVKGVVYKTGSVFGNSNVMVAYATYGNGRVVGVGDSSPCDDGTGDPNDNLYFGWTGDANGNHRTLLMNASIWLASGEGQLPTAATLAASNVANNAAALNGTVNPNGYETYWHFEWGTTTTYGNTTTVYSAGSGTTNVIVSDNISGLIPGTTYHFRLVAINSNGTTNGNDLFFTTTIPTLSVTPSNQIVSYGAGSTVFSVTSNSSWSVTSNQSWCIATPSGFGNGTITADFNQNLTYSPRICNITVTVAGIIPIIVTITQEGLALLPEPSNLPANFSANNILVQWTDATGGIIPQGYLVRMSSVGFSSIAIPIDGVPVMDGPADKNILAGIQQALFENLNPATTYYFKLFGYVGSGSNIDYKTDGAIPQVEKTTQ
jgi:hypothetical protein